MLLFNNSFVVILAETFFIPRKEMIMRIVITVIESKHNPLEHLIHSTYSTYVSNANRPISFTREERTL